MCVFGHGIIRHVIWRHGACLFDLQDDMPFPDGSHGCYSARLPSPTRESSGWVAVGKDILVNKTRRWVNWMEGIQYMGVFSEVNMNPMSYQGWESMKSAIMVLRSLYSHSTSLYMCHIPCQIIIYFTVSVPQWIFTTGLPAKKQSYCEIQKTISWIQITSSHRIFVSGTPSLQDTLWCIKLTSTYGGRCWCGDKWTRKMLKLFEFHETPWN